MLLSSILCNFLVRMLKYIEKNLKMFLCPPKIEKITSKSCWLMAVGSFFFSAAMTAQNSPELHFHFMIFFIQLSLLRSLTYLHKRIYVLWKTYLCNIWTFVKVNVKISLSALRATPKFAILAKQRLLSYFWIKILAGFKSRWIILWECKYLRAFEIWETYLHISYSGLFSFWNKFDNIFKYCLIVLFIFVDNNLPKCWVDLRFYSRVAVELFLLQKKERSRISLELELKTTQHLDR